MPQLGQPVQAPACRKDEHQRAGHAGGKAQHEPRRLALQHAHPGGQQNRCDQPSADQPCCIPAHRHAGQRADEVAEVVAGGQPTALCQRQAAVVQHHRQDGGEGEAADAHRHRQRDHAGNRHAPGSGTRVMHGGHMGRGGRRRQHVLHGGTPS
jgi:hypothetical protein